MFHFLSKSLRAFKALRGRVCRLELDVYAANAAFFILLALFPGMLLAIALLRFTPLRPEDLQLGLEKLLPAALRPLLDYMVQELFRPDTVHLAPVSALACLWSVSKGVYSVQRGLDRICGGKTQRVWQKRLRSLLFSLALLVSLLALVGLQLFGRALAAGAGPAAAALRLGLPTALLGAVFAGMYRTLPEKQMSLAESLPGALCAAAAWMGFSRLFTRYAGQFGHYSIYYGSLSVIAMTMLWLYACMLILFLGGLLNCRLADSGPNGPRGGGGAGSGPPCTPSSPR